MLHARVNGGQELQNCIVPDLVDLACRQIVLPGQADVKKAFIVSQVQVHLQSYACLYTAQGHCGNCTSLGRTVYLAAVIQHEDLSMLEW